MSAAARSKVDVGSLEGWLSKKKSNNKGISLFSGDTRRWFKVIEVKGTEIKELAFCYFKSQKEKEAKGWIYLKDITEIFDDERTFTVVSPSRTLCVSAETPNEHKIWLRGLTMLCPWAKNSRIITDLGPAWHQHQLQQAKASAESKANGVYATNYFLDEKFRQLVAEGVSETSQSRAEALPSESREAPPKLGRQDSYKTSYSLGVANDEIDSDDGGDESAMGSRARRPSASGQTVEVESRENANTNNALRDSREGGLRDSRERESDHRLSDSNYRLSGTGTASGRLNDHIRSGTRGGPLQLERSGSGGDLDESGLVTEQLGETRGQSRRPRGGSRSEEKLSPSDDAPMRITGELENSDDEAATRGKMSTMDAIPAQGLKAKKKAPPPTTDAPPPRRAADLVDDSDEDEPGRQRRSNPRQSIDSLIATGGKRGTEDDAKGSRSDDEDDSAIRAELKAERDMRQSHTLTVVASADSKDAADFVSPAGSSRPPRPPVAGSKGTGAKASAVAAIPSTVGGVSAIIPARHPMPTTARPPRDAGSAVDANFVTEDWDDMESSSELDTMGQGSNVRLAGTAASRKPTSTGSAAQAKGERNFPGPVSAGVRQDENWLNEDFDD